MFCESDVFTVAEVAEKLRCSNDTVYRMVRAGDIGSVTVKTTIRICGWQLNEYLQSKATGPKRPQ